MVDPCWARVEGPLAPYVDGFRGELERLGYTPLTAAGHVRLMAHLSRWMIAEGLVVSALTQARVDVYFTRRRAAGYVNSVTGRSLRPLLEYLRRSGGGAAAHTGGGGDTRSRCCWPGIAHYLDRERGLAATTIALNVRLVRPFLTGRARHAADGGLDLEHLSAGEVTAFVVAESRARPRSVKRMVTALRSLLVFLHVDGVIDRPVGDGDPDGGRPAGERDTRRVGRRPGRGDGGLLRSGTATGRRDFAILTLLVRLGLRAGEVAGLGLDDIDWRRGEITVRGKGNRHDTLPLPVDVGTAIVDYLRARPPAARPGPHGVRPRPGPLPGVDVCSGSPPSWPPPGGAPGWDRCTRTGCGTRRPRPCWPPAGHFRRSGRSCATAGR